MAYAKAATVVAPQAASVHRHGGFVPQQERAVAWGRWVGVAAIALAAYAALHGTAGRIGQGLGGTGSDAAAELKMLAAGVKAGEVVVYGTTTCPHCVRAKGWLTAQGFEFTDCNMSLSNQCQREFDRYRANGVPFVVVRGHEMHDGFDSDEFIAALKH